MTDTMDLDALFKEARAALRGQKAEIIKRKEKTKLDPQDAPPDTQGIYRNPANWVRGKGIALIHRASETLLGNFTEYRHRTVADARRLVREDSPPPVQTVEYIDLDLNASNGLPPKPKRAWQTVLSLTTELRILAFQAHAAHVPLSAHFGDGQLFRLELAEPTIFLAGDSLLRLPAGTDVLPELAPAAVTSILAQLNQPL
jgi:hypothetical protein